MCTTLLLWYNKKKYTKAQKSPAKKVKIFIF